MSWAEASTPLPAAAPERFELWHRWDRNFFLLYVVLIWCGIIMGFGPEIAQHFQKHQPPYPLIVHFHAAAFVGWLVLLTTQVLLIRAGKRAVHRKLGAVGAVLAGLMVILGPATALIVNRLHFGQPNSDPAFLSVQLTDIVAFTGLISGALLWRNQPSTHKRLILLATLYISDAGFNRWLGGPLQAHFGDSFGGLMTQLYLCNDLLILGLGVYDLITRRRLHQAYVAGILWVAAMQFTAVSLYLSPLWKPMALKLIGH